ncbi:bifunctional DNA-binding transcriptional regulator/O6-methylguanine-DNA methyltransferase Ada [Acidihalobacter ferrooxydans]|uniref:methylated-DNA--[protein]-cysteine S-methyltransferase n=1 Tax=Acidihalobacter ferrooxydans TaxID=1765967 RepID=A0A1P8UEL7_9GAMM|nr:bifunctional DNA-binding transcriptional regulator/O6-methylguanine-DNA methyltransferase Ada [Acidihalobacter ferrooxydans]APZ42281.1 bifunctional transcriptional regulator/O6-methylguanine-DNA methyltransferase [Acidihalobacter ferrooxydans]
MALNKTLPSAQSPCSVTGDPRWARIVARDRTADGQFWFSVATTGIYCRPSCPSRHAKPENVRIHETVAEAQAAGFRPCKRCNPDGISNVAVNAALIIRACRMMEESTREPSLSDLAAAVDLSPSYFHRIFKAAMGVTPKRYAVGLRAKRVRDGLDKSATVTEAVYGAGFNSSGRFYEKAKDLLGMTPRTYRTGGEREEIRFAVGETSLGSILVASSPKGIVSILIGDDPDVLLRDLQDRFPRAKLIGADADYEALVARVVGLVDTPTLGLDLPLDIRGTAFQQRVWQALREIPPGRTVSYSEIAEKIGAPTAVRAVAGACAANNIAVAIPCHRVVRSDGSISGYAWGVESKRALLAKETNA